MEIINTGSELMLGYVLNSHQQWMCKTLSQEGYEVSRQVAVSDTGAAIQQAVRESLGRADLIFTTGGLGPTSDDLTRDLIAQLLGLPLDEDPAVVAHIEAFFERRKRPMPASTRVQAMIPRGARVLANAHGTAPGLLIEIKSEGRTSKHLIMLPGPPRELRPMMLEQVMPWLRTTLPAGPHYACRVIKTAGIGESLVEEKIAPELRPLSGAGLEIGYCARVGEVEVRLISRRPGAAQQVESATRIASELLADHVYGYDDATMESVVIEHLTRAGKTVALAESCTGGLIAHRLTNVPGASAVLMAGFVTYSNAAKEKFLGVSPATLAQHGAVSAETVREMAAGARQAAGTDFALSVSGIAGPGGGSAEKPVGTVWMGLATPHGVHAVHRFNPYDRETFKNVTSQQALELLRRAISR